MACSEIQRTQFSPGKSKRPRTFAEYGQESGGLKPYFTTYCDEDRPSSFAELGVDVEKERSTITTRVGKYRKWQSLDFHERIYLVISILFLTSFISLTIERIFVVDKTSPEFTFALLLLINAVCCVYYVIHGVLREHAFELVVYAFGLTVIFVYCLANFLETEWDAVKFSRLILVCAAAPFGIIVSLFCGFRYHRSKGLIFRTVGANLYLQDLCVRYFMFADLLKFDFQLAVSLVILVLDKGLLLNKYEVIVLCVGIPISITWSLLGYLAVRYEQRSLVVLFLGTGWIQPAYITYKFIDMSLKWGQWKKLIEKLLPSCIIICGIIGLVMRMILIVVILFLAFHFGEGVGQKVFGSGLDIPIPNDMNRRPVPSTSPKEKIRKLQRQRPFSWAHPVQVERVRHNRNRSSRFKTLLHSDLNENSTMYSAEV